MAEIIDCPGCKRKLQVPDDVVGQRVQCPTCAVVFTAARGGAVEPPAAAPPPRPVDDYAYDDRERRSRRPRWEDDDDEDGFYDDDERGGRQRRSRRDWAPHRGDMILVLGILAILVCPLILGPMAWIMGNNDLAEIDAGRMDPAGRSNTSVGRVLGIVGTCLVAVPLLFFCFFFGMAAMMGAAVR